MTLRERIVTWLLAPEYKAATGIGMTMMSQGPQMSMLSKDPRKAMREMQRLGIENLYIRAAERVIGDRFSTIPWMVQTEAGEEYGNPEVLRLLERPYTPVKGDPVSSTPQTRSGLWRITCRHLGLTGNAFWYLDQTDALGGWPADVIYINPARMTPAEDKMGNLIGWVLDADIPGSGMPLDRSQVLHFRLEPSDVGHYGIGLIESAFSRAEMLRLADRHANEVLASGGRLTGMFGPKGDMAIPDDAYEQLKRDLRNVAEDPQAARRAIVLKGPIEYTKTVATPSELDLIAISTLGKEGILALWGVPESQLNGQGPGGMNSGETRKYDEATLMQNAVIPRLRAFTEVLQMQLLDRLDPNPQLVIEEPEYDDEAPAYDLATKTLNLPLTNAERRKIIGMEPLGSPMDDEVWLPISLVPSGQRLEPMKARVPKRSIRGVERVRKTMTGQMRDSLQSIIAAMKAEVAEKAKRNAAHLATKPKDASVYWDGQKWEDEMVKAIKPAAALAAESTHDATSETMGSVLSADIRELVLARLLGNVGEDIKGIVGTTRDKVLDTVQATVEQGIKDGLGMAELGQRLEANLNDSSAFGEYRSEMIARTETNRVLNGAQLETYKEYGVARVEAIDGDGDAECAARNGQVYSVAEAALIYDHPNGTLDWAPLTLTQDIAST